LDKFEYKIKADEIKELIAQGEYEQAAEIADGIDWRRVKSVMMLCMVSDLYKICRRYEDSRDLLLLAYERHPGGRTILYSLCELSIKMEEFVQAVEYYKEYAQIAPKDSGRYILQYKLYAAQDVSLEERIAVLEELKKKDYREKWAYELAYLYHRVGLATKCVEECDELFLWFGDGKYVIKALELKKLHAPLTDEQQYKYDHRFGDAQVAENTEASENVSSDTVVMPQIVKSETMSADEGEQAVLLHADTTRIPVEEIEIQVKTLNAGEYDTINLQEELAAGIQEYFGISDPAQETVKETEGVIDLPAVAEAVMEETPADVEEEPLSEVFFGENSEITDVEQMELPLEDKKDTSDIAQAVMSQMKAAEESMIQQTQPPREMANVLSMEGDGQISFVLPEREPVEKQITGQISINDIIIEWERMKKENEEKRREEVRQHVLQQTGTMFTEFEASVRDGLLEQLESGKLQENPEEKPEINADLDQKEEVLPEVSENDADREPIFAESTVSDIGEVEELTEIEDIPVELPEEEPLDSEPEENAEEPGEEETVDPEEKSGESGEEEWVEEPAQEAEETEIVEDPAQEAEALEIVEEPVQEAAVPETVEEPMHEKRKLRNLSREEKELFGQYIQGRSMKEQLILAIDNISMAPYTGNVIVTGAEGMDSLGLAKNIIREIQMTDSNFSGKTAKISGGNLNTRDVKEIIGSLNNGALIIQKASAMNAETAETLYKVLQQEHLGIVVVMEDNKKPMDRFLHRNKNLAQCFTARVDVAALSNDALVAFAKKYAREKEYSIDEFGLLALHTRIADMQTNDHAVTVMDVKEILEKAMESADRKTIGHFFDIILGKRYDEEDMIILKEKDFM